MMSQVKDKVYNCRSSTRVPKHFGTPWVTSFQTSATITGVCHSCTLSSLTRQSQLRGLGLGHLIGLIAYGFLLTKVPTSWESSAILGIHSFSIWSGTRICLTKSQTPWRACKSKPTEGKRMLKIVLFLILKNLKILDFC